MILSIRTWFSLALTLSFVQGTYRYYQTYLTYGSGDTMLQTYHSHGGPTLPHRKWNIECQDGEAMVGIADWTNDFIRVENLWCKFTFPHKPPTNGLYPYYPRCHVRNVTDTFHCYDPARHSLTSNTFITAFQSGNLFFWVHRLIIDNVAPYKCCKTPLGYYIDYVSCYYVPTHDAYFEYYDSPFQFIVYCSQGYVMTGVAKKINPYTQEYRYDWIQCCRVGYGHPVAHPPPVTYMPSRVPAYHSQGGLTAVTSLYQSQYRSSTSDESEVDEDISNATASDYMYNTKVAAGGFFRRDLPEHRRDVERLLLPASDDLLASLMTGRDANNKRLMQRRVRVKERRLPLQTSALQS